MNVGSVVLAEGLAWTKWGRRHWVAPLGRGLGQVDRLKRLRAQPDFRVLYDPYLHRMLPERPPAQWSPCMSSWGGIRCARQAGHPGLHRRHGSEWGVRNA